MQARLEAAKGLPFEPTKQAGGGGGGSGGGTLNQCQNCIEVRYSTTKLSTTKLLRELSFQQ